MSKPISRASFAILPVVAVLFMGCSKTPAPTTAAPATIGPKAIVVTHPADYKVVSGPWGQLTWFVSAEQNNCGSMTVGKAVIKPGMSNPRHHHPTCDEVLHVLQGTILHTTAGGQTEKLVAGDTVTIPAGVVHNAKNIGADDAVTIISFSSAHRTMVAE